MSKKIEKDVLATSIWAKLISLAGLVLFYYFGFFKEVPCDTIDTVGPYCELHPFTAFDFIGTILVTIALAFPSGIFFYLVPEEKRKMSTGLGLAVVILFGIGVALISV